ncbi:GNAT family N-acetyltransferase [Spongiivirga citrea]|uniref:GNAT family N-acetyltransferase n=1 Tax=Spongiivirga citrea TaxID=1481457 RepID=A0A6M0CK27_9FLAO|nr:GNAT family protein [Spongiivirga citrea]NER15787.1 GNAT family N-acetyltransferase [Spongiivirga citrea]
METLNGDHISLRALEPEDLSFLKMIENDQAIWEVSHTQTPYSSYILKEYLKNSHKDIYEIKQLRLVIDHLEEAIGLIDLFDFDPKNKRAGVGVIIAAGANRNKGYGSEAVQLLIKYAFTYLGVHQLYCNISEDNRPSIQLFESCGFKQVGLKKDWNFINGDYKSEFLYQLIRP